MSGSKFCGILPISCVEPGSCTDLVFESAWDTERELGGAYSCARCHSDDHSHPTWFPCLISGHPTILIFFLRPFLTFRLFSRLFLFIRVKGKNFNIFPEKIFWGGPRPDRRSRIMGSPLERCRYHALSDVSSKMHSISL